MKRRKFTHEIVKQEFEKKGNILLEDSYTNSRQKLKFMCCNGHIHEITFDSFSRGTGCAYCSKKAKPKIAEINDLFAKEGYKLLTTIYKNKSGKLYYICPNGHEHFTTWESWVQGCRCGFCAKNIKIDFNEIKKSFEKEDYILLTVEYTNLKSKLDYVCPYGHRHTTIASKWFTSNHRCPTCAIIKHTGSGSPSWKGGLSSEHYCSIWKDKEYKKDIKLRDGNKCLNPCCDNKHTKLHIHHINYNKKDCSPNNLITLCIACNAKANTDRDWHEAWYKAIMYRRYKYE